MTRKIAKLVRGFSSSSKKARADASGCVPSRPSPRFACDGALSNLLHAVHFQAGGRQRELEGAGKGGAAKQTLCVFTVLDGVHRETDGGFCTI